MTYDTVMIHKIGARAKAAATQLQKLNVTTKNQCLLSVADELVANQGSLIAANAKDVASARAKGISESMVDRLTLTPERIEAMADGLRQIATLEDPIGETTGAWIRPNGLEIGEKRVPLGVICMIYESRPNVTADAFGLCFKTGNAVILKGGSDALTSNQAIVKVIREALAKNQVTEDGVILIEDTSRETAKAFMRLNKYIDVLIPRGGAGLIQTVVESSTVPVIETGTGNCHIYVDASAEVNMAKEIIFNAKTQRTGVCNACESLVIHKDILKDALPVICESLAQKNVEIRGDEAARQVVPAILPASEEDWGTEYLDYIISVKTVENIDEAIAHINTYNTKHSEAIITRDYDNSRKFLEEIDAAAVYVNASTRFTDGFEFGFGAEIGISTQKLHARGPMGLKALTTTKFIICGSGQVRP